MPKETGIAMRKGLLRNLARAAALALFLAAMLATGPNAESEPLQPQRGFVAPELDLPHITGQTFPGEPVALPSRWDWREHGGVTPVKNQGGCGSCAVFGAIANMESRVLIDSGIAYDFSENNAKECNWAETGCDATDFTEMTNFLTQKGTVLETCDHYVAQDVECKSDCPYQKTVLGWNEIATNSVPDTEVLKSYIKTYGPVAATLYTGGDYGDIGWANRFNNCDGSYTLYYDKAVSHTDHAVLIIGWDDDLVHDGGKGGWIVKNSWGSVWWGGTCGYGTEKGYFTIAYGSANIGWYSSFVYDWQDYDPTGDVLYYDEGGRTAWWTDWGGNTKTGWGLCEFVPTKDTYVTRVEFWTFDATTDVDVYLYGAFDGNAPSNLLRSSLNHAFDHAGYHSVELERPLRITSGDDVVAVVKFTDASFERPVPADWRGPVETGRTYFSATGAPGTWEDMANQSRDVAIRLRTSDGVTIPMSKAYQPAVAKQWAVPLSTPTATRTSAATATPTPTPSSTPTSGPSPTSTLTSTPTPTTGPSTGLLFLYDHTGAEWLRTAYDWELGLTWANDGQAGVVPDPKDRYGQVAHVYVRGYGHGTETSWIRGTLVVPASADVVAIPMASAHNGSINETDAEAGIEIAVYHPGSGQTVMTYASHIFETALGVDYIVGFADVSEFRGDPVEVTIRLRQTDVCAGSACTTDEDIYVGDLWFERLPDICTTEADATNTLYDYYDDPTVHLDAGCSNPQPYYFVDVEEGPHNAYGVGENTYEVTTVLPPGAEPVQFKVYYGLRSNGFTFNGHSLDSTAVYGAFPRRSGTYVNIAEPSHWMPFNDNPGAVAGYVVPGSNTFTFNVYTSNSWEERPFDLWARFRVQQITGEAEPTGLRFCGSKQIVISNHHL